MIDHLTVGFMQENTYLIMREQGVIVIDPGAECTKIKAAIAQTQNAQGDAKELETQLSDVLNSTDISNATNTNDGEGILGGLFG